MKIEAVVTCVDYADFLAETLPHNRYLFDNLVVVTSPEDKPTQRICEYWHVDCLPTDAFRSRWGEFNKGAAINDGLARLSKTDWLVHMDADILLPPLTRSLLEAAMSMPGLQQENQIFVHPNQFPLGVRVIPQAHGGWLPIGFFQMWNAASGYLTYPDQHADAGRTDMQFAAQWPRNKRAMIPEIIGYHLESEANAPMGRSRGSGASTSPMVRITSSAAYARLGSRGPIQRSSAL